MTFSIEYHIHRFQLSPRKRDQLLRLLNRETMERHVKDRLPRHFQNVAYSDYGARRRTSKYNKRKQKLYGHTRPNYASGHLYQSLRTSITATQYGAKLIIKASLSNQVPAEEWAKMTPEQKAKIQRQQRRLAGWQKREIAILSRKEIKQERARQARDYVRYAKKPEFRRYRKRRIS